MVFGFPGGKLPPRRPDPRRELPVVEIEQTPRSVPPGAVQLRSGGLKLNVPLALLLSVASAVGARLLPTATSTDAALERATVAAERRGLEDAQFREELRRRLAALQEQLDRQDTRQSLNEAAIERLKSQRP